jgi:hypothetical protein
MSVIPDLSDEGLVRQFGDIMHEMPGLYGALRRFEIERRPRSGPDDFAIKSKGISMQRIGSNICIRVVRARG